MRNLHLCGLLAVLGVLLSVVAASAADVKAFEIKDEKSIYAFTQGMAPVQTVPAGSRLVVKTQDCFGNQLRSPTDKLDAMDWDRVNPATGPIFIEGAEPGDALEIKIEKIEVANQGVMMVDKTFGVLKDRFDGMYFKILPIKDGNVIFDDKLSIPIRPMIGVIGVAPGKGSFNTGTPHSHGGNMDTNLIIAGTTLYLPVSEKGALLALGDIHAVQGDGEICGTGVETPATVTLVVNVRKDLKLKNPVLDNGENLMVIASAQTLDEASVIATSDMADILAARLSLDMQNINYLMSAIGDLQISQIVDPLMTARFSMPKAPLARAYGFKF
jgi:amidase